MPKTPLELQEQTQRDSLEAFTKESYAIQAEIKKLEGKRANLQKLFDEEFALKKEEIRKLEAELRDRLSSTNRDKIAITQALADAKQKLDNANNLQVSLENKHADHKANVDNHNVNADATNKDLAQRTAQCVAREEESRGKLNEATKRLEVVSEQEKRIEAEAQKLVQLEQSINEDIVKLNDLRKLNNALTQQSEQKKEELLALQKEVDESRAENEKLRADLDNATHRLANRKVELDRKEEQLKISAINNEIKEKELQTKQDDINSKMGKLSDLEAKVNILMANKEKAV